MPEDFDPKAKFLSTSEYLEFVSIITDLFTVAERNAWGSLFARAERTGWITRSVTN